MLKQSASVDFISKFNIIVKNFLTPPLQPEHQVRPRRNRWPHVVDFREHRIEGNDALPIFDPQGPRRLRESEGFTHGSITSLVRPITEQRLPAGQTASTARNTANASLHQSGGSCARAVVVGLHTIDARKRFATRSSTAVVSAVGRSVSRTATGTDSRLSSSRDKE